MTGDDQNGRASVAAKPAPNLIRSGATLAGAGWWYAPHAISRLTAQIPPRNAHHAVREHALLNHTDSANSAIQGYLASQAIQPGETYCASVWVWLPLGFTGTEVSLQFKGYDSLSLIKADLACQQKWQQIAVTARIPPGKATANPTLCLAGPIGTKVFSTSWCLEMGTTPSEPTAPAHPEKPKTALPANNNAEPPAGIFTRLAGFFRKAPTPSAASVPSPPPPIVTPSSQPALLLPAARHATPTKWYFAVDRTTLLHNFDQVQAAVLSARAHTRLRPICLLDDSEDLSQVTQQISWLERTGVSLILHSAQLFTIVQNRYPDAKSHNAQWLRCDIPILDSSDEYVLYTEPNIIFRKPIDLTQFEPPVFACTPDKSQNLLKLFDSSVMLINLPAMRATRTKLMDQLQRRLPTMLERNDHYTINDTYKDDWITLPSLYNWKPYWGFNPDAAIVHFHGPTPETLRKIFAGEIQFYTNDDIEFFRRNPEAYKKYLDEFYKLPIAPHPASAKPAPGLYQCVPLEALQPSQGATIARRTILPAATYPLPPLAYGDLTHNEPDAVYHAPVEAFTITNAVIHGGLGIVSAGDQIAAKTLDHMPWHNLPFAARQTEQGLEFPAVPDQPTLPAVYHLMACNQDNYYHWLIDVTLRFVPEVMADFAQSANGQAVILHPPLTTDWKRECLDLLLPDSIPKLALTLPQTLKAKRLVYVPELSAASDNPHPALLQTSELMRIKALGGQPLPHPTRKIFVSRADSQHRVLTNEAELSEMARQAGFETIILTGMKVADQIKLFAQASHIIAPHGAALTNILFCQPGAKLLELHMDSYLHRAFHRLAALRGVTYGRLIGQSTPIEGVGLFGHTWQLDPQKLAAVLSDPRFL